MSPFGAAGVGAGGAFVAGISERSRLRALAAAAHAVSSAAAHLPVVRHAGPRLHGAVAVVADVAGVALTLPAVTFSVTWQRQSVGFTLFINSGLPPAVNKGPPLTSHSLTFYLN